MHNNDYTREKIIKFIYVQPEKSVSIDKILHKFRWITRDDLRSLLLLMEQDDFVILEPKSNISFELVGDVDSYGTLSSIDNGENTPIVEASHVQLALKGKDKAEEHRALLIKSRREFIGKPLYNSLVSGIIGFILGYLVKMFM